MKKIISAGLATILAASALSTAAFADEFTMTAESVLAKPAIKVTLPKSMSFVFNPYGLSVDIKGKVATEANGGKGTGTVVVPSYLFESEAANQTGWKISNGTGAPLKAAILAYAINKTDAEFVVVDATTETLPTNSKRALKVAILAGEEEVILQNVPEKIDTKTKSIWDATDAGAGATILEDPIAADADLVISLGEDTGIAHNGTDTSSWSEKDVAKINFVFGFDLAELED